jgi:hypothetical protein
MSIQLSKKQIEALKVELAQYGLNVSVMRSDYLGRRVRPRPPVDWISAREQAIRAVAMKRQSAFWKTAQLKALKLRRQISPEYEAFITGNNQPWYCEPSVAPA